MKKERKKEKMEEWKEECMTSARDRNAHTQTQTHGHTHMERIIYIHRYVICVIDRQAQIKKRREKKDRKMGSRFHSSAKQEKASKRVQLV